MTSHDDIIQELRELKQIARANGEAIAHLDKDLAVHKAKTSRFSMLLSVLASLAVTVSALFAKGCM